MLLLPPTVMMGATLPAIARWVKATPEGMSRLGFFYGSNIVGAVFGCLLVYVAIALSGVTALGAQVVWTRLEDIFVRDRSLQDVP